MGAYKYINFQQRQRAPKNKENKNKSHNELPYETETNKKAAVAAIKKAREKGKLKCSQSTLGSVSVKLNYFEKEELSNVT